MSSSYLLHRDRVLQSELLSPVCCLHMHQEGELAWTHVARHLATIFIEHHVHTLRAVQCEGNWDVLLICDAERECVSLLVVPQAEVVHHRLLLHTLSISLDQLAVHAVFNVFELWLWIVCFLTVLYH